jgi:hypothetical protein
MKLLVSRIDLFLFGFFLYCFGYAMLNNADSFVVLSRLVQITGLCIMGYYYICLEKHSSGNGSFVKIMIFLFLSYGLFIVLRGDYSSLKPIANKFYDRYGIFQYLAPLLILLPIEKYFYKILKMLVVFSAVYIVCMLLAINNLFQEFGFVTIGQLYYFLGIGSVMLLYFWNVLKRDWKIICICTLLTSVVFASLLARRAILLDIGMAIFLNTCGYFFFYTKLRGKVNIILSVIFVAFIGLVVITCILPNVFYPVLKKGTKDTRSHVEQMMIKDFQKTPTDFIIGRGIDGRYVAPYVETNGNMDRNLMETGYLHLIQKGGYIYLSLFVLFLLPTIIKGLRSKNYFSIQSALIILQFVLSQYHTQPTMFAPQFFMLWVCVAIIYKAPRGQNRLYSQNFVNNEKWKL